MADQPMTREELERLGALLWGYGWKSSLADHLDINRKTVSRWIADGSVPAWAADKLRTMAAIAPPPATTDAEDHDDACQDAIEPELVRLMQMAVSAGWNPAEVWTAVYSLVTAEVLHHAGAEALSSLLDQTAAHIKATP